MDFNNRKHIYGLISVFVVFPLLFIFIYNHNNKYKYDCPQPAQGVLNLAAGEFEKNSLMFLIEGWEFYQQTLLSPEDFEAAPPVPDSYVTIGQYAGFNLGDLNKDIHGHGTYRLTIHTGIAESRRYMLEIPEIFSAYCLWINGVSRVEYGNSQYDKYRPEVANNYVNFAAEGTVEIIIAVSDFSSRTPGIASPPAFGSVSSVSRYLIINIIFTAMFFFISMIIGTLFIFSIVWTTNRTVAVCIGLLCYSFAWVSSYPLVNFVNIPNMEIWYILENFFYYYMILSVLYLQTIICGFENKFTKHLLHTAIGFCIYALLTSTIIGRANASVQQMFTIIEHFYIAVITIYLVISTGVSLLKGELYSPVILMAVYVFAIVLVADAFVPYYEPLYLDWTNQMGGLAFIAAFSVIMNKETSSAYRLQQKILVQNAVLKERARLTEYQLVLQQEQFRQLADHIEQTRTLRHDLRHHISVIGSFVEKKDLASLKRYVDEYRQSFPEERPLSYCENSVVDAVVGYYLEIAAQKDIETSAAICLPEELSISGLDLCIIFGNCLENALEACERIEDGPKFIDVRAKVSGNLLSICFSNSFDGVVKKQGEYFLTRKKDRQNFISINGKDNSKAGNKGIGITSVKAVAQKYGGEAHFENDGKVFRSTIMLKISNDIKKSGQCAKAN